MSLLFLLLAPSARADGLDCKTELHLLDMKMNVIASNIANINSTRTPEGGPYKRKRFSCVDDYCTLIIDAGSPLFVYEPEHPDAGEDGYVEYPNISLMDSF